MRALVTGGASGLGLALTKALLAQGDLVVVGDLAESRPESVPGDAAYLTLDVRSERDWEAARDWVDREWGRLDLLVNNAGIATGGRIDVETTEDWQRVLDINLMGVVRGCRTFTPIFKRQRDGHIVNVASLAGFIHGPGMSRLQRDEGRGRCRLGDARIRARPLGDQGLGRVPVVLPDQPAREHARHRHGDGIDRDRPHHAGALHCGRDRDRGPPWHRGG